MRSFVVESGGLHHCAMLKYSGRADVLLDWTTVRMSVFAGMVLYIMDNYYVEHIFIFRID